MEYLHLHDSNDRFLYTSTLQESTYGTNIHEDREDREARFTGLVHDIVTRGGRCLIPVFALGRAQELLLILGKCFNFLCIHKKKKFLISKLTFSKLS